MIFEQACVSCDAPGALLCPACARSLQPVGLLPEPPPGVHAVASLCRYEGVGQSLVAALKFRNRRAVAALLGPSLALVASELVRNGSIQAVTWAPTSAPRRRRRGYDQAELLGMEVGHALGLEVQRLLRRHPGVPQTARERGERWHGPRFDAVSCDAAGVLVIDDVLTTGATMAAAAAALQAAGVGVVSGCVVAATPLRGERAG